MTTAKYADYLQSPHWKTISRFLRNRASCSFCSSTTSLDVHHKNYERLWNESPSDLVVLCRDCHARHHEQLPTLPGSDQFEMDLRPVAAILNRNEVHAIAMWRAA